MTHTQTQTESKPQSEARTQAGGYRHAARIAAALLAVLALTTTLARAADKPPLDITGYTIDATLNPAKHTLDATAIVTFTAQQAVPEAEFQLHGALKVHQVTDASGTALNGQRGPNETILVTPAAPLTAGQSYTWTFRYSGTLDGSGGPVPGLKLASIGDPISYLLYAGAWFPMTGYQIDRFTADIHIHIPAGYTVIGSGAVSPSAQPAVETSAETSPKASAKGAKGVAKSAMPTPMAKAAPAAGTTEYDFKWDKPGFPGTIIAGKFIETSSAPNIHLFTTAAHKADAHDYAKSALDIFAYFTSTFGMPESTRINIVELPDDTVPAYWAPEIAAVAGNRIPGKTAFRLLSNTIAHLWWGSEISPATL
ncbi:MAG: peptidase M1, partial [Opitutaceae bacterium]